METDPPPASESSDRAAEKSGESTTPIAAAAAATRSYECNFCKRGFSNAQALGGHMNIHRKDKAKAKLKKSSTSKDTHTSTTTTQQQLLKIPTNYSTPPLNSPILTNKIQLPLEYSKPTDHEEKSLTKRPAWDFSSQGDIGVASRDEPVGTELDLELRLGVVPHKSSAATGMRKFL